MPMSRSVAALSLASALAAGAAAASAQTANCTWYAETALKQQQRNARGKCGFAGPEWSMSRQTHLAWCALQSPDRWKAEAQKREQMLASCKP
jgi:uncharacterized low-complexity protein